MSIDEQKKNYKESHLVKGVLLADDPGLGKTIQSVGVSNAIPWIRRVLIVCPASLKFNWRNEWLKWDLKNLSVGIAEKTFPETDICIINFDILKKYRNELRKQEFDLMIVDEVHYLKNGKADRTKEVFGGVKRDPNERIIERIIPIPAKKRLFLSGTPMLNGKPKEMWNLIKAVDPNGLGSDWFSFAKRYCELFEIKRFNPAIGKEERIGWKWDGNSHLNELQSIMRNRFMIRRLKSQVLKELPPKTRQVIVLGAKKGLTKLLESEIMEYDRYVAEHGGDIIEPPAFAEVSRIRKEVALAKVPYVIEYLREVLDETQEKVVCWVHHQEVRDVIQNAFGSLAVGIDGRTNSEDREKYVNLFQEDKTIRLFIGGVRSAGTGLTLTAANIAIFVELDWTPAIVTQAEDRCHRIGQRENVLIRHIVLNNSLDQRIVQKIIEKQEIADKALDKEIK